MKLLYTYFWKTLPIGTLIWLAPIWLIWAQIVQPTSNHLKTVPLANFVERPAALRQHASTLIWVLVVFSTALPLLCCAKRWQNAADAQKDPVRERYSFTAKWSCNLSDLGIFSPQLEIVILSSTDYTRPSFAKKALQSCTHWHEHELTQIRKSCFLHSVCLTTTQSTTQVVRKKIYVQCSDSALWLPMQSVWAQLQKIKHREQKDEQQSVQRRRWQVQRCTCTSPVARGTELITSETEIQNQSWFHVRSKQEQSREILDNFLLD